MKSGITEMYRAGSQLWKVRAIMLLSVPVALGATWWGWDLFHTYGLRPADGGVPAPFLTRLALGVFVASLGIAFAAGMWFYGRLYASAIRYDAVANALHVRTVGLLGGRETVYPVADVLGSTRVAGRFLNPTGVSVDAPWYRLELKNRRLPLIVDAQGGFLDRTLAVRLLKLDGDREP